MADQSTTAPSVATHGVSSLPEVEVDSYNLELKDDEGLLGDRANRGGEISIGRAAVILKSDKVPLDLLPIRHEPDEAGLIGAAHLAPRWMFEAHDAILAVDIGGTNIRAGVVALNLKKASDLSKAFV